MIINKFKRKGKYPFDESFKRIKDGQAKAKILNRLRRLELGNHGDYKNILGNLYELRINTGKGWRVYYEQQGDKMILLFLTGNKATQSDDIAKIKRWRNEQ